MMGLRSPHRDCAATIGGGQMGATPICSLRMCEKARIPAKTNLARKDGSLGELWTCLREAASAKAGPNLKLPNL
jgi:hypothetical protein